MTDLPPRRHSLVSGNSEPATLWPAWLGALNRFQETAALNLRDELKNNNCWVMYERKKA